MPAANLSEEAGNQSKCPRAIVRIIRRLERVDTSKDLAPSRAKFPFDIVPNFVGMIQCLKNVRSFHTKNPEEKQKEEMKQ